MSNIDVLKQEIQSWYPDYEFTDEELNSAVRNLIKFFATGVLYTYEAKNKGLQSAEFPVKLNK
ncbi:MAG: hypothetical protein IKO56_07935 [Alphaproteobacteria bacterium]|nr:hypothetical protein [Alphaproteobacteria bacterium]MBR6363537.1 hypothetical protein [Alphaproteobacteria bacterium]